MTLTTDALAALEQLFAERATALEIDLCPYADARSLATLAARGYTVFDALEASHDLITPSLFDFFRWGRRIDASPQLGRDEQAILFGQAERFFEDLVTEPPGASTHVQPDKRTRLRPGDEASAGLESGTRASFVTRRSVRR